MEKSFNEIKAFWNDRATLGIAAGTQDIIAKQLEIEAISKHITDGMEILDIGCGNGVTAVNIAERHDVHLVGLDYSSEMIKAAKKYSKKRELKGSLEFYVGNVLELPFKKRRFNLVYTERALINLPDWPSQKTAIEKIASVLLPGGQYLMCENSQNGLNNINLLRSRLELPVVSAPWHNRYLIDNEVRSAEIKDLKLVRVVSFSSTYYFLSRVVNAWLALQAGEDPDYQAPVNHLALQLPPIGNFSQTKLWIWVKTEK